MEKYFHDPFWEKTGRVLILLVTIFMVVLAVSKLVDVITGSCILPHVLQDILHHAHY